MNIKDACVLGLDVKHTISVCNIQREQLPNHLASQVRICDPSVWSILSTVHQMTEKVPLDWKSIAAKTGFIMLGNASPSKATQKVIQELNTRNHVSPMSFINANAGAAISICATHYGFQGPSINFTTGADASWKIALILAQHWLQLSDVEAIFLIHARYDQDLLYVDNFLLSAKNP